MDKNKKRNGMNEEKVIDLLWEVKEGKKHPNKAYKELCNLFDVRLSLPNDVQIEETADVAYKYVREHFPIDDEYCYTQGYINGMTALRNSIQNNEA